MKRGDALSGVFLSLVICFILASSALGATVSTCDDVGLRTTLNSGGTVTFACDGVITLTNTLTINSDTTLDGSGHNVTISGGGALRVFIVNSGVSFKVLNLTIADGKSTNGGGIYNHGGVLTLVNCIVSNNVAIASNGVAGAKGPDGANTPDPGNGGNGGPGSPGEAVRGGAIYNLGFLNVTNCTFVSNSVRGGNGGVGGIGGSGGEYLENGRCHYSGVGGTGGSGGVGGDAFGAAICNLLSATIETSSFVSNTATGGNGGIGGKGGFSPCCCKPGGNGGNGADAGQANAAAIYNIDTLNIRRCAFFGNQTRGGFGGAGGPGDDFFGGGGKGARGGTAEGGAVVNTASASALITMSTLTGNTAIGGDSGFGGLGSGNGCPNLAGNGGDAIGGALANAGTISLVNCTLWQNNAVGGIGAHNNYCCLCLGSGGAMNYGTNGVAFASGILNTNGTASLVNTIVGSSNSQSSCGGPFTDEGHNICSDSSAAFSASGSQNNTDPKIGLLADNGGPTQTLALQSGSPAIDGGDDAACPPTDQRGVLRPQGGHCDSGAFEQTFLSIRTLKDGSLRLEYSGVPGEFYALRHSIDFNTWGWAQTNTAPADGRLIFDTWPDTLPRFFKVTGPHHFAP